MVEVEAAVEVVEAPSSPNQVGCPVAEAVNIETTLADSGLVMVQTTSSPIMVAQPEAPVKLGRPRAWQSANQGDGEALIMAETGKMKSGIRGARSVPLLRLPDESTQVRCSFFN